MKKEMNMSNKIRFIFNNKVEDMDYYEDIIFYFKIKDELIEIFNQLEKVGCVYYEDFSKMIEDYKFMKGMVVDNVPLVKEEKRKD